MQENTIENNKLIAEFMGLEQHPGHKKWWIQERQGYYEIQYHTSWDWLMPVVEKIENLDNGAAIFMVEIIGRSCCISHMVNHNWPDDKAVISEYTALNTASKIGAVYAAIIQFIQFYNTQKAE